VRRYASPPTKQPHCRLDVVVDDARDKVGREFITDLDAMAPAAQCPRQSHGLLG